jgi:hypothetical protein
MGSTRLKELILARMSSQQLIENSLDANLISLSKSIPNCC